MSKRSKSLSKSTALARTTVFGQPPIFPGEDREAYDDFLARISKAVAPTNIIEQIWVKDIADLSWEIGRLRNIKARLIADDVPKLLAEHLQGCMQGSEPAAGKLVRKWIAGDPDAKARVEKLLTDADSTIESVYGQALANKFDRLERLDQMIMLMERRRNSVFHEIERHRMTRSQALRKKVDEIEDAEFKEVGPETDSPQIAPEAVAS